MNKKTKQAIWEATKEPLRYALLGVYAWLITEGVVFNILSLFDVWLSAPTKAILVALILSFLRGLDKYQHLVAKDEPAKTRKEGLLGEHGLTGF